MIGRYLIVGDFDGNGVGSLVGLFEGDLVGNFVGDGDGTGVGFEGLSVGRLVGIPISLTRHL